MSSTPSSCAPPTGSRRRPLLVAAVIALAVIASPALAASRSSAATACSPGTIHCFAVVLSPASVPAGSTRTITAAITNESPSGSNSTLRLVNITPPAGFTIATPLAQPSTGSADLVAGVIQLTGLSVPAQASLSYPVVVTVASTTGTFTWTASGHTIAGEQSPASEYDPDLTTSALTTSTTPSADLSVTQSDTPDPVIAGNTVLYSLTAHNTGPQTSTVSLSDSISGGGTITRVLASGSDAAWACTSSSTTATCSLPTLASGTSSTVTIAVTAPGAAGSISCGSATVTGLCSTATVSGPAYEPAPGNNVSAETTTVNPAGTCTTTADFSCATGFISYDQPSAVTTGDTTDTVARKVVGTIGFPATSATGGQLYSLNAPSVPTARCPGVNNALVRCQFEMDLQDIPAPYTPTHGATLTLLCNAAQCPTLGSNPQVVVFKSHTDGSQETLLSACTTGTHNAAPLSASRACYTATRGSSTNSSDLVVTVYNLEAGDPKVYGVTIAPPS